MSAERPLAIAPEVSGVHRLEPLIEALEQRERPSLRVIELSGRTPPASGIGELIPTDLGAPELYLNRELTWLEFNRRVLPRPRTTRNPLLERVKFLAITGSNMDEFFMKRIGGLKQQVGAQAAPSHLDGRTPQQQIVDCHGWIARLRDAQASRILERSCSPSCARTACAIALFKELDPQQRACGCANTTCATSSRWSRRWRWIRRTRSRSSRTCRSTCSSRLRYDERPGVAARARQGAGRRGHPALPAGRRRSRTFVRSRT